MKDKTAGIVDFLVEKYEPMGILVFGSRAEGTAKENSDWDIFVIGASKGKERDSDLVTTPGGELLDIAFKDFPEDGEPLTTAIKPLWPAKVLFDVSRGALDRVLKINEESLKKGPLVLYKEGIMRRHRILLRRQTKIEKHVRDNEAQFLFAAILMEIAIRLWFELQNIWSLPIDKAISVIEEKDPDFCLNLKRLCVNEPQIRMVASRDIVQRLSQLVGLL